MQFEDVFWENNNYMIIEEDITDSKAALGRLFIEIRQIAEKDNC